MTSNPSDSPGLSGELRQLLRAGIADLSPAERLAWKRKARRALTKTTEPGEGA